MSDRKLKHPQLRILIVDDDSITRGYLKNAVLAFTKQPIHEVSAADKIIDSCERYQPNLIFLDIDLDGRNGLELIKHILELNANTQIIMVSAYSTADNVQRALADGARGFIVKPFTIAKIIEAVNHASERLASGPPMDLLAAELIEAQTDEAGDRDESNENIASRTAAAGENNAEK